MNIKSTVLSRLTWKTGALLLGALATLMVLVPRVNSVTKAEECQNPPTHAVLNYWPVSFDQSQTGCTDFTTLDGKIVGSGSYSTSQADHDDGLQVADGQEVYLLAYVHNGAAQNGNPNLTTARNVRLDVNVPTSSATDHTVTASWSADNTNTASGSFTLHTAGNRTLEIVPNSGQLFDPFGNTLASGINISNEGVYTLGDQQACFEFARFMRFKVRVTNPGAPALSITKQVRNITQNTSYSSSVSAVTGDTVGYEIKVRNTGTAAASNVTVTDNGTSGTSYINGTLQVSNGGSGTGIPGTITLGTLQPSQEVTITYSANVTGGNGSYTNTATTQATGISPISATATVNVTNIPTSDNAECVSVSLNPASPFSPGQNYTATVRLRNNGTTTWTANNNYSVGFPNGGITPIPVPHTVAPGQEVTIGVNTFAPTTPGSYTFAAQMQANGTFFGQRCETPVVVNAAPVNNADCVSIFLTPTSPFTPNQPFTGTIKVRNNGNTTWTASQGFALGSQNPQGNTTWGTSSIPLPHAVAPGQEIIFNISTQAPANPGNYSFAWRMSQNGQFFGATCETPVVVNPVLTNNAECVSFTLTPASPFTPGQNYTANVRVRNTGNTTWTAGSGYAVNFTQGGLPLAPVPGNVAPGQEVTISVNAQAANTPGTYTLAAQMVQNNNAFGPICQTTYVVNALPQDNAECISVALTPASPFTPGQAFTGTIRVRNTGNTTWAPGTYALGSQIPQDNTIWGTSRITLNSPVTPGGEATFTINTHAPATVGSFTFAWQMVQNNTFFGPICQTPVVVNPPVLTNGAECVSVVLSPAGPFNKNQGFIGTITVRNIGTTTWMPLSYALGSQNPANNTTWGVSRVNLLGTISPGREATFTVSTQAPNAAGTYSFAWQMVQDNTFFGPICSAPVVVREEPVQNTALSIIKNVRNVTDNTSFTDTVNADNGDTVEYEVRIRNIGNTTATNVTMRDNGTSGTSYIDGTLVASPALPNDQNFPGTISLGNLAVNAEVTIRYQMRVTGGNGTYTNTAVASASNATSVQDTARVIVNQGGGGSTTRRLAITKLVRNLNVNDSYRTTTSANVGDRVQFQITVRSTGNARVNDVELRDTLPSGLRLENGSIQIDGRTVSSNSLTAIDLDDIDARDEKVVTLIATVESQSGTCTTRSLQNVARATARNANAVQDDASVTVGCVAGTSINLAFSKRAWNDTKGVDATSTTAARGDSITYTLTVTNTGNADATNFVITDDLSGVLPFADMVDRGGATLSGVTLSYPQITIPAGATVSKTFKVRVKTSLSQSLTYQLQNTYGNTVVINVGSVLGSSTFIAPVTGAAGKSAGGAILLIGLGFAAYWKRSFLKRLIMA